MAAAFLIRERPTFVDATTVAIAGPWSDDPKIRAGLVAMIETHAPSGG